VNRLPHGAADRLLERLQWKPASTEVGAGEYGSSSESSILYPLWEHARVVECASSLGAS
jgi:hypothetical protein